MLLGKGVYLFADDKAVQQVHFVQHGLLPIVCI